MTIRITQLHHAEIFGDIADLLETVILLRSLDNGNQIVPELIRIVQRIAAEAAEAALEAAKQHDKE